MKKVEISRPGETSIVANLENFDPLRAGKIQKVLTLVGMVINSPKFKNRVLSHQYNSQAIFADNNGKTNAEIYQIIKDGQEILKPGIDNIWNLELRIKNPNWWQRRWGSANAFTYKNTLNVWIYSHRFDAMELPELVNLIIHEQMHNLGFGHDFRSTPKRPFSVPYGVGGISAKCAREIMVKRKMHV